MRKLVFAFVLFSLLFVCSCKQEPDEITVMSGSSNLNIIGIQDYGTLKSIGVGIVSEDGSRAASSQDSLKLVGVDESGDFKVIKFLDDNGRIISQEGTGLINFRDFYSYILFQFAPPEYFEWLQPGEIDWSKGCGDFDENYELYYHDMFSMRYQYSAINNYLSRYPNMRNRFVVYLLDKKTGKIYELLDDNSDIIYPTFCKSYGEESSWFVTDNYAGFEDYKVSPDEVSPDGKRTVTITNYRMSIEEEELKLEKLQSNAVFNDWESGGRHDRYGNCYSKNGKYLINNNGQLKSIGDGSDCFMGMNDIFYVGDQWVDENGDLEAASFLPQGPNKTVNASSPLVKTVDNVEYYFVSAMSVSKVTYLSDDRIEYTIEKIDLEDFSEWKAQFYISNGRILFLSGSAIAYFTPEDGKRHILSDQYFYNSMTVRLDGTVLFTAVDSNFNVVEGAILPDGTALTAVSPAKVSMISIAALN